MVSAPTRHALFALSSNECAFPGCDAPMVDAQSESVVGEICHIRAQGERGPRFVSGLSDWELHGPANLILLCRTHHKVADDHPDNYPIEALETMKADHESAARTLDRDQLIAALDGLSALAAKLVAAGEIRDPFEQLPWINRPGAPQFRMSPGIANGELLCSFEVSGATELLGGIEARWTGAGTPEAWVTPMTENPRRGVQLRRQLKPTSMNPVPPEDEVALEVLFNWGDGQHGGRWTWPLRQHRKGHWVIDSHLGSHVHQPAAEDTW